MKIYRGEIKRAYVKSIDFCDGVAVVATDSITVKKDALFYIGMVGRTISFDYDTYLATKSEAFSLLELAAKKNSTADIGSCLYVDYSTLVPEEISKTDFKQMKKTYKEQMRIKRGK